MHIQPLNGLPLVHVSTPHITGIAALAKRALDVLASGLGLVLISPLLLGVAIASALGTAQAEDTKKVDVLLIGGGIALLLGARRGKVRSLVELEEIYPQVPAIAPALLNDVLAVEGDVGARHGLGHRLRPDAIRRGRLRHQGGQGLVEAARAGGNTKRAASLEKDLATSEQWLATLQASASELR